MNKPNKKYDHVQCSLQTTHCMAGLKIIQKRIKVRIDWFNNESGNIRQLISTCHYRPTIVFCDSHQERHWSFILDFYSSPEFGVPTIAEGTFLAETLSYAEETWNKMRKGTHFFIMEGNRRVGIGTVLEEERDFDVSILPSYLFRTYPKIIYFSTSFPKVMRAQLRCSMAR